MIYGTAKNFDTENPICPYCNKKMTPEYALYPEAGDHDSFECECGCSVDEAGDIRNLPKEAKNDIS